MISYAEMVAEAERLGMPGRTLEQVQIDIADARRRSRGRNKNLHSALARLMLRFGRLQPDARAWLAREYR